MQPPEDNGVKTKTRDEQERERGKQELENRPVDTALTQPEEEVRTATKLSSPKRKKNESGEKRGTDARAEE